MPSFNSVNKKLIQKMGESVSKYENLLLNYKDNLVQAYQNALLSINVDLAKMYAILGDEPTLLNAQKFERLDKLFNNITTELKALGIKEENIISKGIQASFQDSYYHSAYAYESAANVKMGFTALNKDAIQASLVNPLSKIKWQISSAENIKIVNNNIRSAITEGLIQGHGYRKTAKRVASTILNFQNPNDIKGAVTKAFRIVTTETHRAFNNGADIAFNQAAKNAEKMGIDKFIKVWTSSLDLRTRSDHQAADGKKSDGEGIFHLFGVDFESAGNTGIAEQDINCRCAYYVQMDELTNKKRWDNISKKPTNNVSYCEWFKNKFGTNAAGCKKTSLPVKKQSTGGFKKTKTGTPVKKLSEKQKTQQIIDKVLAKEAKKKAALTDKGITEHVPPKKNTIIPSNSLLKTTSTKKLSEQQISKNYDAYTNEYNYTSSVPSHIKNNYKGILNFQSLSTIRAYSQSGYRVNKKLAVAKSSLTVADIAFTQNLNDALEKLPLYNGLSRRVVPKVDVNLNNYLAGTTIEWEAFTSSGLQGSTFLTNSKASYNVLFHLNGKTGRYIDDISYYSGREKEVLFKTNSKWYVERVEEQANGHIDIFMSEVL